MNQNETLGLAVNERLALLWLASRRDANPALLTALYLGPDPPQSRRFPLR